MVERVVQFPKSRTMDAGKKASTNIEKALDQFLAEFDGAEKAQADCEHAIDLFKDFLNNYAYQSLSPEETEIFERHYNAEGKNHKDFCELFGPEKIPENVGEFVSYFLVRKVMASASFIGQAARVVEKLCRWLVTKGYVAADDIEYAARRASTAAKQLPRAQKAGELLWKEAGGVVFNSEAPDESGYMDITRIEPGKLWLRPIGGKELGPINVSAKVTELLEVDWEINCGLKKAGKSWRFVEVGSVYPH